MFLRKLQSNQDGFTITELLVVLPVATILTVSLMAILFSQYGAILAESSRSSLRSSGQALLTTLQDELLFTIEYGHELHEDLVDPNEPSGTPPTGGWRYNTDPQTLIIDEAALDSSRRDDERNVIRHEVNNCETSAITANSIAVNNVIYFVEDNPDSNYDRLYKRTVIPTYDTCSVDRITGDPCTPATATCLGNAKQTTCPEAELGNNGCTKADALLSENIVDFDVRYFDTNNVETTFPSAGEKIIVDLVLGDLIFGRDIEVGVSHTIRKIN